MGGASGAPASTATTVARREAGTCKHGESLMQGLKESWEIKGVSTEEERGSVKSVGSPAGARRGPRDVHGRGVAEAEV
eukprot:187074-Chlamydomonas_euryale.AAC.4